MPFKYVHPPIEVWADWGKNTGDDPNEVQVYIGYDREKATDKANFWDERVDVRIENWYVPMDALSVAMRKFDQLAKYIATTNEFEVRRSFQYGWNVHVARRLGINYR